MAARKKAAPAKKTPAKAKAPAKKRAPAKAKAAAPKKAAPAKKAPAKKAPAKKVITGKLRPGAIAPPFGLKDQSGRIVSLTDYAGRKLLVYFYPRADTPGCTVQSCSVRDHRKRLGKLGVDVVGISPDSPATQKRFDQKFTLGFPLLSDQDRLVARAWGAFGERTLYGRRYAGIVRSSFLVDESGRILAAWYGVKPDETVRHAKAALAK